MMKHNVVYPMNTSRNGAQNSLISMLLGFFGVTAAFLLLPKTVKFVIRRFLLGIVSEIVAVILAALLTEKLVDIISEDRETTEHSRTRDPAPRY